MKILKNSYNAGLLTEYMSGRTDLSKYYNGCSKLINATVLPHGGFVKRPGTEYIATAPNKCNLKSFEFSVDDALVLEFSNELLRFYKDGAPIYKPYGTEDLSDFDSATGDSSLVAHWLCDDKLATTAVLDDTVAGTHDGVASANTSTITAADESGTANKAFDLGGTAYVEVDDHDDFTFGDDTDDSPFTLLAWVYVSAAATDQTIISKWSNVGDANEWRLMMTSAEKIELRIEDGDAQQQPYVTTDSILSAGWHFIVATYNGVGGATAAGGMNIYVDWVKQDVTRVNDANYDAMANKGAKVGIGFCTVGGIRVKFWENKIHNVAILNKELSEVEIASLTGADSTTPYSITSPYTSAEAFEIHTTQSADVMYIAHEDHHPQKLSRLADTSWTIEDVPFTGGPFLTENTTDTHLVGFARTGGPAMSGYYFPAGCIGTLTATAHSPFNSNMVGALWLVKHTRPDNTTTTFATADNSTPTLTTFASGAIKIKGDFTVVVEKIATTESAILWRKQGNGIWQQYRTFRADTAYSGSEDEDDVYYAMTENGAAIVGTLTAKNAVNRGIVRITGFTSSAVVTVEVVDPVLSDNATDGAVTTSMWAEGAWSDYRGYPRTVTFYEDRLWWASSTNDPDTLWASKNRLYENMSYTNLGVADDALILPINDNEVSQVQWMVARQVMAVGAANKEYRVSAVNPDNAITPDDRKVTPQTGVGSGDIQPVLLNNAIFFLQRQNKKLMAMKYDAIAENFDSEDATLLAYGLLDSTPTCMAVQRVPDPIIWVVRTDGILPTFTYEPKEEVAGWALQLTDNSADVDTPLGFFESTAVIHGSTEDEVWVSVRRVIDGSTVYYIERFKPRDWGSDIEDACYVDSAYTYDGAETEYIGSGIDHLIGKTVSVFADGEVFDDAVVNANGYIDLKKATVTTGASVVQVGIPYTMKARTMKLEVPSQDITFQSRIKRVHSVVVRYIKSMLGSAGVEYGGTEYLQDLGATFSTSAVDTSEDARLAEGGFNEDCYVTIVSDDPVPFTCLANITSVEVEEKR